MQVHRAPRAPACTDGRSQPSPGREALRLAARLAYEPRRSPIADRRRRRGRRAAHAHAHAHGARRIAAPRRTAPPPVAPHAHAHGARIRRTTSAHTAHRPHRPSHRMQTRTRTGAPHRSTTSTQHHLDAHGAPRRRPSRRMRTRSARRIRSTTSARASHRPQRPPPRHAARPGRHVIALALRTHAAAAWACASIAGPRSIDALPGRAAQRSTRTTPGVLPLVT